MQYENIKTAYDLKYMCKEDSLFFSRNNMKFAGDTMRNYGLRKHFINDVLYFELYRRKPVKMGLQSSAWFKKEDDGYSVIHCSNPFKD